ncbi:MAG TPA: hypothetical protein ENN49_04335 [Bacteroidales bacterium]|nr:hypothetical protein [Bacteroidales bacterium]
MKKLIFAFAITLAVFDLYAQETYHHISNSGIYEFIDELNTLGIVEANTSAKPYSRNFIKSLLIQASEQKQKLNNRQRKELEFYLADFDKDSAPNGKKRFDILYRSDSLYSISINPLLGVNTIKNDSAFSYNRWVGAEVHGHAGRFGFYASLRDYAQNYRLAMPTFLTREQGGNYKIDGEGGEFSEMRGGITYGWRWGSIGVVKDHVQWGSGYNGTNILGGRTPSFAMIKLNVKPARWIELNYIHGWLVSQVIDSSRTYISFGETRKVYHNKYIAANLITFKPYRGLNLSVGNSIIYSNLEVQPAYLIPFFFYKSIDHHLNGISNQVGQNSQMFFDVSSYTVKHLHLYATLFLDELSMKNMFNPEKHSNFYSLKAGFRLWDFILSNLSLSAEYTRTNPLAFKHIIETTTYESNRFNLGHYLTDNADEVHFAIRYYLTRGLQLYGNFTKSRKGPDYTKITTERLGLTFMEQVDWEQTNWQVGARFQIINDGYIYIAGGINDTRNHTNYKYTPSFMLGKQLQIESGICWGF